MNKLEAKHLNQSYRELYRDYLAFSKKAKTLTTEPHRYKDIGEFEEEKARIRAKLSELYHKDRGFEYCNKKSILIFLKINGEQSGVIQSGVITFHRVHHHIEI